MPISKPPYPAEFRQQMVELVQTGRTPAKLAREFKSTYCKGAIRRGRAQQQAMSQLLSEGKGDAA